MALWWFDVWLFYPFNPRAMSLVVGSIAFFSYNIPPFPLGLVSYTTDNLPPLPSFRAAKGPLCAFYECQTLIKKNHLVFIFQIFYGKVIQRFLPCCSLCPLSDSLIYIYIYSYQGNVWQWMVINCNVECYWLCTTFLLESSAFRLTLYIDCKKELGICENCLAFGGDTDGSSAWAPRLLVAQ